MTNVVTCVVRFVMTLWHIGFLVVLGLLVVTSFHSARSQSALEYKADLARILKCVESAEQEYVRTGVERARQCIGAEAKMCWEATEPDYSAIKRANCAAAEAKAWEDIAAIAYVALSRQIEREDKAKQPGAEPALPDLVRAHEAWQRTYRLDCTFFASRPGDGTLKVDGPALCVRDKTAERALQYRRWLRGFTY